MSDDQEKRQKFRQEIAAAAGVLIASLSPLTSALGFSPLTNVWSGLAVLIGAIIVFVAIWLDHRGSLGDSLRALFRKGGGGNSLWQKLIFRGSVVAIMLLIGGWLQANAGKAATLLIYGSLSDLDIQRPSGIADPATIRLRRSSSLYTCFLTTASFSVRNATSSKLFVGLISPTLSMTDNANFPVFIAQNAPDVTSRNVAVAGIALIKGVAENWSANIESRRAQLTALFPGATITVSIQQNGGFNDNCSQDQDGSILRDYRGKYIRVSGAIAIVRTDNSFERQDFSTGDLPALVEK